MNENNRYVCLHGHFYQPPRENPWLEDIELQDSAAPYHDWNDRITAECYAPNTAARIIGPEGTVVSLLNNYCYMSFNFGPTLLSWLERHNPYVYAALIEADRVTLKNFSGHGSAMAQGYNHLIMPLANRRDKDTQIKWGIADFAARFKRMPEGMWLPETAVDTETLELIAEAGIRFTVLSPRQARRVKPSAGGEWIDTANGNIDTRIPYLCRLPSGKNIALFFYDGAIAQNVAFGGLLNNGETFARTIMSAFNNGNNHAQLVNVATDGETYGHHHKYGDMALGYCINYLVSGNHARITNYGEFLEKFPPFMEAEIIERSSWSCVHGVERWRDNCGCNSGMHPGWHQRWRKPLREAMDSLRDILAPLYEREAAALLSSPWSARDNYINVILNRSQENIAGFFAAEQSRPLSDDEKITALKLLEMQRNAMLMYTSCGWFFDEISGIENTQVLQYASRAIQLAEELSGVSLEPIFLKHLQSAASNIPSYGNGANVYELFARPARVDFLRLCAHYSITALFNESSQDTPVYCYSTSSDVYDKQVRGKLKRFIGKTWIISGITLEKKCAASIVVHLGDHNIACAVRYCASDDFFTSFRQEIGEAFDRGDIVRVIKLMSRHFGGNDYSLVHLFKDEQRKILSAIMKPMLAQIETYAQHLGENNSMIMEFYHHLGIPVPRPLTMMAGYRAGAAMQRLFEKNDMDILSLRALAGEIRKWPLEIDKDNIGYVAAAWINNAMKRFEAEPFDITTMKHVEQSLNILAAISLPLNIWETQNIFFSINRLLHDEMEKKAAAGDTHATQWLEHFHLLGNELKMKV